ncbi:MAG: Hpt domain-containing protein, partial [Treponema sp.]|nr:Hpt domain-containing protein [Treponema sp.]
MAIDKSKYIGKFVDEGFENISVVETLLFEIKEGGSVQDDLVTLMRALHTLKGSARMLEFKQIESLSHALESVFAALKEERIHLSDQAVRLILAGTDELKAGLSSVKADARDGIDAGVFQKELAALAANEDFTVPRINRPAPAAEVPGPAAAGNGGANAAGSAGAGKIPSGAEKVSPDGAASAAVETPAKESRRSKLEEAKSESIRISLDRINEIIRNTAALQSLEIAAKNIARDTEELSELSRRYSALLAGNESYNSPLLQEFRPLETMISKFFSTVKNYAIDVGNHTRGTYDSVISLRMLPLSTVLDAYPRYVFTIASELG